MLMLRPDPELGAFPYVVLFRSLAGGAVVHSYVKEVHACCVLTVVTPNVGLRTKRLEDDCNSVQLGVAWVKNVAGHRELNLGTAKPVERSRQVGGNGLGGTALDLVAVDEVHDLAIPKQCH